MDFPSNEITFGDFSNLKQEDEVYKILFGPRQTEGGRVEFPWDSKENYSYVASEVTDEDKLNQQQDMQEGINFSHETHFNLPDASGLHKSFSFGSDSYPEYPLDQSQMDMDGNNSSSSSKPYERRNKKRRPPGYYEKLQEDIEKERIRKLESNMHSENITRNAVNYEETSYTSQSDRDTVQTQYIQKNHTDYAQNYASAPPVQNNFQTNISQGVELVTDDISRVTLSKDDSLAHSHMVHTTHENVSHPSMFHTSQTPIYPSQTSCPPPQTSVYTPQPWLPDSSNNTQTVTHNTNPASSEHIDLSFTSVNKPPKSSISSGYEDTSQEIVAHDIVDSSVNQTNISEDIETESENLVDFASYPPLQPASNNIPIGAPGNKQESGEKSSEILNVEENSPAKQENSSGEQSASVWGAKPKSWANLFKGDSPSTAASVIYNENYVDVNYPSLDQEKNPKEKQVVNMSPVPAIHDSAADILGDFFCQNKIMHTQVGLQPRGLMNRGNWCYINATLQALISCPPFYNLMKKIPTFPPIRRGPTSTPILDSMIQFVGEFTPCARATTDKYKGKKQPPELPPGQMFEPTNVYKMLQVLQDTATFKLGRQEDAEEFLSCILDGMHEEMVACMRVHKGETEYEANGVIDNSGDEDVDPDSWEQVGPKKKSVLTRKNDFEVSPLADIFVGYIRSAVFKTTSKDSATVEPFFTLKLDIQSEKVCTVREALERMVSKESVSGFTCSKTNAEMEITKKLTIEQLPPVLILHLKCFVYDKDGGSQKLLKDVNFTIDLEITKDLLSPSVKNKYPNYYRQYKLFAVVYHHGKKATGGHYTTAVFHPAINRWVIFDDSNVKIVPVTTVLQFTAPRVPYLLYYRRLDSH
ncbi:ubiquitin carboxyl-terminal hydrolase 10-like [Mytilus trossulus]|uniref:ubiquitin carboxyl-terminal hydrolase 10-like n=1 Tax=Mytilus trossulus TaxID=6551 RepID=UPI0030074C09